MKILQLTKKVPWPLVDGETIALHMLSKGLVETGSEVHLLSMNPSKQRVDPEKVREDLDHYGSIEIVDVDNSIKPFGAFKNLFSKKSYHIDRFDSSNFHKALNHILSEEYYDLILFESIYMAPYLNTVKSFKQGQLVLRSHNVESKIWERIVAETNTFVKRQYLRYLQKKLMNFENSQVTNFDFIASVSEVDNQIFKNIDSDIECMHLPIGIDLTLYEGKKSQVTDELNIGFIGSLDWQPNVNGLKWFFTEVWPNIHSDNIKLSVAGRNPSEEIYDYEGDRVRILGEIDCARSFMRDMDLMIVPLFSGSGTRVKIIESLACKTAVLSTSIGLEGIDIKDGVHCLIADNATQFIKQIEQANLDKQKLIKLADNAFEYVKKNYDYKEVAASFKQYLNDRLI